MLQQWALGTASAASAKKKNAGCQGAKAIKRIEMDGNASDLLNHVNCVLRQRLPIPEWEKTLTTFIERKEQVAEQFRTEAADAAEKAKTADMEVREAKEELTMVLTKKMSQVHTAPPRHTFSCTLA